jgi:hypothetical protein
MPGKVTAMKCAAMTLALVLPMLGTALSGGTANAQAVIGRPSGPMVCGQRTEIVRQLSEKYGETRRSVGVSGGQRIVEVYASDETGSWTILITSPYGTACLVAAGEAFEPVPVTTPGEPT